MSKLERFKTEYPGVFFIPGTGVRGPERIYYIRYRRDGKMVEEKAGKQNEDQMTAAKAARIRAERIEGRQRSNNERRTAEKAVKDAEDARWPLSRLWKQYKSQKSHESKTVRVDDSRFKKHVEPSLGDKQPCEILPLDVDRIRLKLLKKHAPQTAKHVLGLITRLSNYGSKKALCAGLTFKPELPHIDNEKTEFLTDEQMQSAMKVLAGWPDRQTADMMLLGLLTGMRRGELYKLQWKHVDMQRAFAQIKEPKGGKSEVIPLNASARGLLEHHPRINKDFVFAHKDGRPFSDKANNHRELRELRRAIGLPDDFRPTHGMRHSFASALANSGKVDMYVLQKLMTHKSPRMTQRYAHLRDKALKDASELMTEILGESKQNVIHPITEEDAT